MKIEFSWRSDLRLGDAVVSCDTTVFERSVGVLEIAMTWKPATIGEVKDIVKRDLESCDPEQIATFHRYAIDPYLAKLERYGKVEEVVVVARNSDEVLYWNDVEEGFNISPVGPNGAMLKDCCNQDELGIAVNQWIKGREHDGNFSPAKPI